MPVFGTIAAALALIAGALYLRRLRTVRRGSAGLTDAMVRRIEASGRLELEEPLDLDHIQDEESRFWEEERWDEAEEL